MRKSTLALALLLTLCFATTARAFSFDWGVTGGMNLSKVKLHGASNDYFNSDNRAGWFVGAKANVGLFLGFGLDGALLYSQQKLNFPTTTTVPIPTPRPTGALTSPST